MANRISVAEARKGVARLIQRAQQCLAIEITRRGRPVAVLLSADEYLRLIGERPSFVESLSDLRARFGVDELGIGAAEFAELRAEDPGREVEL